MAALVLLGSVSLGPLALGQEPRWPVSPDLKPTPGSFLIASRWLEDSNFGETVVLLIEVGSQGAMGIILNRRTSISVAEALPQIGELGNSDDFLYAGGPVEPNKPLILVQTPSPPEGSKEVLESEVYLLTSHEAVRSVTQDSAEGTKVRIFGGYAGWAAGQLEAEIARADWHLLPASARWIFDDQPQSIWSELLKLVFLPTA